MTNNEADDSRDSTPRKKRTVVFEGACIIESLNKVYLEIIRDPSVDDFIERYFKDFFDNDELTGDAWKNWLFEEINGTKSDRASESALFLAIMISLAYAVEAMKAAKGIGSKKGEEKIAWNYLCDANYWLGIVIATHASNKAGANSDSISIVARKAAYARHAENRAIKALVLEHYEANIEKFTSKDAAAEEMAGKIAPVKFRTVRNWIAEYHKRQSARTP